MCIILTDSNPTNTKLFNIPVYANGVSYNMSIYINNLVNKGKNGIMVVPYPATSDISEFGLVDISSNKMKSFISGIENYCIDDASLTYNFKNNFLGKDRSLEVFRVGNYNISVAQNISELLNRIDWNTFTKPYDFEERCQVFNDGNIYPFKCYYVVAQAIYDIKDDGFGILYKNNGMTYFPTAHEYEPNGNKYDVICYDLSNENDFPKINLSKFGSEAYDGFDGYDDFNGFYNFKPKNKRNKLEYKNFTDTEYSNINKICDRIQNYEVKFLNKKTCSITIPNINFATKIEIKGVYNNNNIMFKNNFTSIKSIKQKPIAIQQNKKDFEEPDYCSLM